MSDMPSCWVDGKCVVCHLPRTPEGHDPCIADLPGVAYACCGHGGVGYVSFASGHIIRFQLRSVERMQNTDDGRFGWDQWPARQDVLPWFSPEYDSVVHRHYYSVIHTDSASSGKGVWIEEVEATPQL